MEEQKIKQDIRIGANIRRIRKNRGIKPMALVRLLQLEGVNDMDAARALKQVSVLQLPVLAEYAWQPRRIYGVVATLCITLLVLGIVNLLKAVILDHVD